MKYYFHSGKCYRIYILAFLLLMPIVGQIFIVPANVSLFWDPLTWLNIKWPKIILLTFWYFIGLGYLLIHGVRFYILVPALLVSFVVSGYILFSGESIEYEVFAALFSTNRREAVEVFVNQGYWVLLLAAPLAYITAMMAPKEYSSDGLHVAIVAIFFGVFGLIYSYSNIRDHLYQTYPLNLPFFAKMYWKEGYTFRKDFSQVAYVAKESAEIDLADDVYVLVIGESARKASMSAYGYDKKTTPFIDDLVSKPHSVIGVFNAVSGGISTRISVPLLLSTAVTNDYEIIGKSPTLMKVFKAYGYDSILISNQETNGRNNDTVTLMFDDVAEKHYLSGDSADRKFDGELVPLLSHVLSERRTPLFVIIHLMGSHAEYSKRYPPEYSIFSDYDGATYDNSIYYTDHVLEDIFNSLSKASRPFALFYTSDHGENMNDCGDGNRMHAVKEMTPFEVEVPFYAIFNESFVKRHNGKVVSMLSRNNHEVSHDNLKNTLLGFVGIGDSSVYFKDKDLSSSDYRKTKPYAINRRLQVVDVNEYLSAYSKTSGCLIGTK